MEPKNYGLKFDEFDPNHYFLGGGFLGTKEILPSGDWSVFCPLPEYQSRPTFDTQACARFGTLNALEMLFSFVLKEDKQFSDRFLSIVAGASRNGDSPQNVIEAARKIGLIDEADLPFDSSIDNLDKFYSPNPMSGNLLYRAKEFLKQYSIGHEWVYPVGHDQTIDEQNAMIATALKRSPVGASVSAWHDDGNGGYDQQWVENHWCVIIADLGDYWKIYDSYDNIIKKYSKKSKITMAKLYTVSRNVIEPSAFSKFWDWVVSLVNKETTVTTVQPVAPIEQVKKSDLTIGVFCLAIQNYEGYKIGTRSYRNCNPGNLKYRQGMYLAVGQDKDGFAIFKTYKDGFLALTEKIRKACIGESTVYSPDDTILTFFQKYAPSWDKNNPDAYAKYVASKLKVNYQTFKIKELIA